MNGWTMAGIALAFFGLAWAVDALFSFAGLAVLATVVLLAPFLLTGWMRLRLAVVRRNSPNR